MTAAHLGFAFVAAGWLTFVCAFVVVASNLKPKETTDAAS